MRKYKIYLLFTFIIIWNANAQVGVFTEDPKATLHVNNRTFSGNINGNLIPEGIGIPRISKINLAAKNYGTNGYNNNQNGVTVFVDDITGDFTGNNAGNNAVKNITEINKFYYFNGEIWLPIAKDPPSPFVYASSSNTNNTPGSILRNSIFFKYASTDGDLAYENQVIPLLPVGDGSYVRSNYMTPNVENDIIKTIKIDTNGFYDIKAYFGWNSANFIEDANAVIITIKLQKSVNNGTSWETISSATVGMINIAANSGTTLSIPNIITNLNKNDMIRFAFQTYKNIPVTSSGPSTTYIPSSLNPHSNGTINKPHGLAFTEMILINKI